MSDNRVSYLWRFDTDRVTQKKINDWMEEQSNIRDSLKYLVLNFIDRFGNVNVMDYEVQKQLYADVLVNKEDSKDAFKASAEHADKTRNRKDRDGGSIFSGIDPKNL